MTLPHKPSAKTKEKVYDFKSFGISNEEIAAYLEISIETLTKYYKEELKNAVIETNGEVAKGLARKAIEGDVPSMIFWLKTRARWKTADNISVVESNEDLKKELLSLRAKLDQQNKRDY